MGRDLPSRAAGSFVGGTCPQERRLRVVTWALVSLPVTFARVRVSAWACRVPAVTCDGHVRQGGNV